MAGPTTSGLTALLAGEGWHYVGSGGGEPAFENSWANVSGATATAFRIREAGAVDLFIGGAVGSAAAVFTLPAGYRPSADSPAAGAGYAVGGATHDVLVSVAAAGTVSVLYPVGSTTVTFAGSFWLDPPAVTP